MGDQTKLADLPSEMLCEVLKHLCLADLMRCKSVCKDWNSLISTSVRLTGLVVERKRDYRIRWYHDNRLVAAEELCEPYLFLAQLNRPILRYLNSLKVNCVIDEFEPNDLNVFTNLLRLELTNELARVLSLKLPKLEFCSLDVWTCDNDILIDCPNLKVLHCQEYEFCNLKIKHPESIVELKINCLDSASELAQFKNLERLIVDDHQAFEEILLQQQSLRLIRFDRKVETMYTDETAPLTDQLKELLRGFLSAKRSSKRADLELYFAGLHVTDDTIENIDLDEHYDLISDEHFYMKNYEHLQERIRFVTSVNYTRLMSLVDEVPEDYTEKFCEISTVTVEGTIENEGHLLGFLKKLNNFDHLQLENVNNLSQAFVERLPEFCPQLWNFELNDNSDLELDFDFIRRFKKLKLIFLKLDLSVRSAKSIINVFKDSSTLQDALSFRCNGVFYRFESQNNGKYKLYVGSDLLKENCSLDGLISYLEEHKTPSNSESLQVKTSST